MLTKSNIRVREGLATIVNFELSPLKGQHVLRFKSSSHDRRKRDVDEFSDFDLNGVL